MTNHKACIISCGVGGHYPVGIDRLERSLNFVGWCGDTMLWRDYPENCPNHVNDGQYNFKVRCFEEAFKAGYKVVIWADCILYAVNDPMPIFDYVNEHGLYFFKSGYSLAQTATDKLMSFAGEYTREDLLGVSEFATGLVGINIDNPKGLEFFTEWKRYMDAGMFGGSRTHEVSDSQHPLFLFSRQDQSAASMVLHKMGVTYAGEDQDFQSYFGTGYNKDKIIFFIKGI